MKRWTQLALILLRVLSRRRLQAADGPLGPSSWSQASDISESSGSEPQEHESQDCEESTAAHIIWTPNKFFITWDSQQSDGAYFEVHDDRSMVD